MAVYAIGDLQGCLHELEQLLELLAFDPQQDKLWFAGDLVNRGRQSLETLRYVRDLGDAAVSVLGNHDLHLLAGVCNPAKIKPKDTLNPILDAPDRDELVDWLRRRPLLHHDADLGFTLLHAGLPPQWDLAAAQQYAGEVETILRDDDYASFLEVMYGDQPDIWDDSLEGLDRLRFIVNCFTRLRYCDAQGRLALRYKGAPGSQPDGLLPWFSVPNRKSRDLAILFGHWSTLGDYQEPGIYPLDSGCVWGGQLTALKIDGRIEWQRIPCAGARVPELD